MISNAIHTNHVYVMIRYVISRSVEETLAMAEEWGRNSGPGAVFALTGELGAGKTIIAKGIARGLGITDDITSPTFTLLEIYEGVIPLYHFDLYRIDSEAELDLLDFESYWEDDGVSVIEWADKACDRLPAGHMRISIEYHNESSRSITIEYPGD